MLRFALILAVFAQIAPVVAAELRLSPLRGAVAEAIEEDTQDAIDGIISSGTFEVDAVAVAGLERGKVTSAELVALTKATFASKLHADRGITARARTIDASVGTFGPETSASVAESYRVANAESNVDREVLQAVRKAISRLGRGTYVTTTASTTAQDPTTDSRKRAVQTIVINLSTRSGIVFYAFQGDM